MGKGKQKKDKKDKKSKKNQKERELDYSDPNSQANIAQVRQLLLSLDLAVDFGRKGECIVLLRLLFVTVFQPLLGP
jgi:hypothetical protein